MVKLSLFSQMTSLIPRELFSNIVNKHGTDKYSKGIDSWTHLVSMLFCHLGHANSVRDISNGLRSITGNIKHLGCSHAPAKSTVSYVNEHRHYVIFQEFYYVLADYFRTQTKFSKPALKKIKRKVFLLDASVISLSLSLYDWAKFRTRKGAVKLHLLLDYEGCLPAFADLTHGKVHEIKVARKMRLPLDSILVFDMGYYDFSWWYNLDSMNNWFVTRAKDNMDYEIVEDFDLTDEKDKNVLRDCNIRLKGVKAQEEYPKMLRMVRYWDEEHQRELVFITNNRSWTATTVAMIYKERWYIESFFKMIKQNLKIKSFVGTSENAVQIQIWTALITILLLAYLKTKAQYKWHMSNLITFIRLNLFVKIDLWAWINEPFIRPNSNKIEQLLLFDGEG
jgi:hypothetical protein